MSGNLLVRFDEGRVGRTFLRVRPLSYSTKTKPAPAIVRYECTLDHSRHRLAELAESQLA